MFSLLLAKLRQSLRLTIFIITLILIPFWYLLYDRIYHLQHAIIKDQQFYLWVLQKTDHIIQLRKQVATIRLKQQIALVTLLNQEIITHRWNALTTKLKSIDSHTVEMTIDNINFNELITTLEKLAENNAIRIIKISIRPARIKGEVSGMVLLTSLTH